MQVRVLPPLLHLSKETMFTSDKSACRECGRYYAPGPKGFDFEAHFESPNLHDSTIADLNRVREVCKTGLLHKLAVAVYERRGLFPTTHEWSETLQVHGVSTNLHMRLRTNISAAEMLQ